MSTQLNERIRHHYRSLDESQEPVVWSEVVDELEGAPISLGSAPGPWRRIIAVAIAVGVVLLLALPAIWRQPEDPVVATTTSPAPSVTALTEGSSEATVTWTEFDGMPESRFSPFPFPDGFVWSGLGVFAPVAPASGVLALWNSVDGTEWKDTGHVHLDTGNGVMPAPGGLWWTWDFSSGLPAYQIWKSGGDAVSMSGYEESTPDAPEGLRWVPFPDGEPVPVGDVVLVPITYSLRYDWREILGLVPGQPLASWQISDRLFSVAPEGASYDEDGLLPIGVRAVARVLLTEHTNGLSFTNDDTGELLHFISHDEEGIEGVFLADGNETGLRSEVRRVGGLFAVSSEGNTRVDIWPGGLSEPFRSWQAPDTSFDVIKFGDIAIAYLRIGDSVEAFRSQDGLEWETHPAPPSGNGWFQVESFPDHLQLWINPFTFDENGVSGGGPNGYFISTDGETWEQVDTPGDPAVRGHLFQVEAGWLFLQEFSDSGHDCCYSGDQYFSSDLETWLAFDGIAGVRETAGPAMAWGDRILVPGYGSNWLGAIEVGD